MNSEALEKIIEGMVMITEGLKLFLHKDFNEVEVTKQSSVSEIKLEQIRAILSEKASEGKSEQVKELIKLFKAERLSDIGSEYYEELFNMAEKL